jgi:hypothetical protein
MVRRSLFAVVLSLERDGYHEADTQFAETGKPCTGAVRRRFFSETYSQHAPDRLRL